MRAAIYGRVSTKDGRQDAENQAIQLREFCHKMGWELVAEFTDKASGKRSDNRTQFQKMFEAASRREFDVLVFWSLDRLSREGVVETLNHLQRLGSYGVSFRSFTEQYLDSTGVFKEAIIGILSAIAKQERVRISERVKAGLERAKRGGWANGQPGRPSKTDDGKLVQRVQKLREDGASLRTIASETGVAVNTVYRLLQAS